MTASEKIILISEKAIELGLPKDQIDIVKKMLSSEVEVIRSEIFYSIQKKVDNLIKYSNGLQ